MTTSGLTNEILALHGFLGLAADWDQVPLDTEPVDLWVDVGDEIETWARRFNHEVADVMGGSKPVLMGYSMGGRLAMAAVTLAPQLYSAAVFVSAHPGLGSEEERAARRESDAAWAQRFRTEAWARLMASWSGQPVLRTPASAKVRLDRRESDFDRERLAAAMMYWSLGRQPDFRDRLRELEIPALFIAGELDGKFCDVLNSLELSPRQRVTIIPGAGHRVPWDEPVAFASAVRDFLAGV